MYGTFGVPFYYSQNVEKVADNLLIIILITVCSFTSGVLLIHLKGFKRELPRNNNILIKREIYHEKVSNILVIPLFIIGLILFVLHVKASGDFGLRVLISNWGDYMTIREYRLYDVRNSPFIYVFSLYSLIVLPILTLIVLYKYFHKKNLFNTLFLIMTIITGIIMRLNSANKLPIVIYIVMILFGWHMFKMNISSRVRKNNTFFYITLITVGLILFLILYIIQFGDSFDIVVYSMMSRIFFTPVDCLNDFLIYYPDHFGFQWGKGIQFISLLLGNEDYEAPHILIYQMKYTTWGTSNAIWSADMWANFGYMGVFLGSLLVGILLKLLDNYFQKNKITTLDIALYSYLITASSYIVTTSIFTVLWSFGLFTGPLFVYCLRKAQAMVRVAVGANPCFLSKVEK